MCQLAVVEMTVLTFLKGTIVATVTGAFDASAAVFLLFRIVYDGSGQKFTPDKFFFGYLIVPALILLAQIFVMPRDGYKTITQLEEKIEKAQDTTRDVSLPFSPRRVLDSGFC